MERLVSMWRCKHVGKRNKLSTSLMSYRFFMVRPSAPSPGNLEQQSTHTPAGYRPAYLALVSGTKYGSQGVCRSFWRSQHLLLHSFAAFNGRTDSI
jgi:hypothetical protein